MAKYTTEVRSICETLANCDSSCGYNSVADIIENSRKSIFDFNFPIYDENYRSVIETKILKHFYTREIGFETVGLWKLFLDKRLNEIMPFYNQLYASQLLEFNPLYDTDLTTDHSKNGTENGTDNITTIGNSNSKDITERNLKDEREIDKTNTGTVGSVESGTGTRTNTGTVTTVGTGSSDSEGWDKYSDTPQGAVTGLTTDNYLTNARHTTDENDTSNNETVTNNLTENTTTQQNGTTTNNLREQVSEDIVKTGNIARNINGLTEENTNGTKEFTNTESYLQHIVGKGGASSYSKLLMEYRKTFLNIDMEIIENLSDLFLNLW